MKATTLLGHEVYACEICGLAYDRRDLAERCEEFCRTHPGTCSMEIGRNAVGSVGDIERPTGG